MTLARGLLLAIIDAVDGDEVEAEHLAREWQGAIVTADAAADRIRSQASWAPCTCARPGESADDGRCSRCWGWPP